MFVKCKTDRGIVRDTNEDYVLSLKSDRFYLLIVADGVGGSNGGEIASKAACVEIRKIIFDKFAEYKDMEELVRDALVSANKKVYLESINSQELSGMSTTITCCLIVKDMIYLGHVGDSRAYIINEDGIKKITQDHSYVQELIDNGGITENEAMTHPKKNLITRSIGMEEYVVVDTKTFEFGEKDILLMCTDGLTNYVNSEEIYKFVIDKKELAADYMVDVANQRGGRDNISVIIAGREDGR